MADSNMRPSNSKAGQAAKNLRNSVIKKANTAQKLKQKNRKRRKKASFFKRKLLLPLVCALALLIAMCTVILDDLVTISADKCVENIMLSAGYVYGLGNGWFSDSNERVSYEEQCALLYEDIQERCVKIVAELSNKYNEAYCKSLSDRNGWDYDMTYQSLQSMLSQLQSNRLDGIYLMSVYCLITSEEDASLDGFQEFLDQYIDQIISLDEMEMVTEVVVPVEVMTGIVRYQNAYDSDGNRTTLYTVRTDTISDTENYTTVSTYEKVSGYYYSDPGQHVQFDTSDCYVKTGTTEVIASKKTQTFGTFRVNFATPMEMISMTGYDPDDYYCAPGTDGIDDYNKYSMTNLDYVNYAAECLADDFGVEDYQVNGSYSSAGHYTGSYVIGDINNCVLYAQGDSRWGALSLGGGTTMGRSGCGLTCIASVIATWTGDLSVTPVTVADYAKNIGGSDWRLGAQVVIRSMIPAYGLRMDTITNVKADFSGVRQALNEGKSVIVFVDSVGGGSWLDPDTGEKIRTFTSSTHFFVLIAYVENGMIACMDPAGGVIRYTSEEQIQIAYHGCGGYTTPDFMQAYAAYSEEALLRRQGNNSSNTTQDAIADLALSCVGNPYVWGGSSLTSGADCSGLAMAVYQQFGYSLPHSASQQSKYGKNVTLDVNCLKKGDLVFYLDETGDIGHVTIYVGNGQVVSASSPEVGTVTRKWNYRDVACVRRLID